MPSMLTSSAQQPFFYRFIHNTLFPLFLIIICPPTVMLIWYTNTTLEGSLMALSHLFLTQGIFTTLYHLWKPVFWGTAQGWRLLGIFMVVQLLLMRIIPGKRFEGPITPQGNVPLYKANGVPCYFITLVLFYLTSYQLHWFSPTIVYANFGG